MVDSPAKILLVEDEPNLGSTLSERLKREGYEVIWSSTQAEAIGELSVRKFDLALLDVGLPDGNGFEVGAKLRSMSRATAIVFLTAMGDPDSRVRGLELGAEDYVVKPFHLKELLLRIQNALKRAKYLSSLERTADLPVNIGRAQVNFSSFELKNSYGMHSLTHKECACLKFLYERRGQVVSRDEILNFVWSENEYPSPRTVDNFILKFRKWIEADPEDPQVIKSIRGVGYLMQEDL